MVNCMYLIHLRGPFGRFVEWHHSLIKCYQIIHFWKLELNRYMMVCSRSKKKILDMHVQHMLEMSRFSYTGVNLKENVREKSIEN